MLRPSNTVIASLLGLSLVAGTASYVPEAAAKPISEPAPATQQTETTPGRDFVAKQPALLDAAAVASKSAPANPIWPAASSTTIAQTGSTGPVTISALGSQKAGVSKSVVPASGTKVDVLGQDEAARLGVAGLALRLGSVDGKAASGKTRLKIDYSGFRSAYGGDWATRLRLVELNCTITCTTGRVLPGTNDAKASSYSADVDGASSAKTLALTAGPSGPNGSYAATSLSSSSAWQVATQTGSFNWNYPFRVPPAPSGLAPELALAYDSGSVDGQTASTNNQPSWAGQGHNLEPGFVERKYVACADDMGGTANNTVKTGDLCWRSDNATLSLGSHSSELLWDSAQSAWKLRNDDGSKMQKLTGSTNGAQNGEYWLLTTSDGTKYYFGLNPIAQKSGSPEVISRTDSVSKVPVFGNNPTEPCNKAAFKDSYCTQAWRWSLDQVVDPTGNLMTYRYKQQNNYYGRNNGESGGVTQYQAASTPWIIEYGERVGADVANPPTRVTFTTGERCVPKGTITCAPAQFTAANAAYWPDIPFDQICTSATSCPNKTSPAFFSRVRLATVNTEVLNAAGTSYGSVDTWTLRHTLPDPGDGTAAGLWLANITHQGRYGDGGAITNPSVDFTAVQMPNRVDKPGDGAFTMNKMRIRGITTESGQQLTVNYTAPECTPTSKPAHVATNSMRCFPAYWTIEGGSAPTLHYFHKYLVKEVVSDDLVTDAPDQLTSYQYDGDPAWHYDDNELSPPKYRTWSDWRGYQKVEVRKGIPGGGQTRESYLFGRGMHGDRGVEAGSTKTATIKDTRDGVITDVPRLNGYLRERITYNGVSDDEVSGTINGPWVKQSGAGGGNVAQLLGTAYSNTRTMLATGNYRNSGVITDFDDLGMPVAVHDRGDTAVADDDRCSRMTYVRNPALGITSTVSRTEYVAASCDVTPSRPAQVISDERTYYDNAVALTTAPTKGLVTKVETLTEWTTGPVYKQRMRSEYDDRGRVIGTWDGLGHKTSTVQFLHTASGTMTEIKRTDLKGFVNRTIVSPAWGSTQGLGKVGRLGA